MDGLYTYDPQNAGSKGLVFVGDRIIVYRRDEKTSKHPLELDLPGGGPEDHETPFATFQREVKEEFDLRVTRKDVTYAKRYASTLQPGTFGYFVIARLPASEAENIRFGNEGTEYMLMTTNEYLARTDAWPVFQERTRDYLARIQPAPSPE